MDLFTELSTVIVFTAALAGIMRLLKQPIVIGYILSGLLLGPQFLNAFQAHELLTVFSELGIAILLFIVGLHLSPAEVKGMGKPVLLLGLFQVIVSGAFGFFLGYFLGFTTFKSIYIATALTFSSTIIVLKLLSDKKDTEKLYWRLTLGILLFQDIVAAVSLIFASGISGENPSFASLGLLFAKGISVTIVVFLIARYFLPRLSAFFAKSQEYLFVFSLAWGLGLAFLFGYIGLSIEIGALIAGVTLSSTSYSQEIGARLRTLRDFFVVMFFISLGLQITDLDFSTMFVPLLVLLFFTLVVKPTIITFLMLILGYNKKTAFFAGISLGQISEFSMILLLLGVKLGHIDTNLLSLMTILAVISITVSTYMIMYTEKLYPIFAPFLHKLEKKKVKRESSIVSHYDVLLFGCNRVGYDFIKVFKKLGSGFLPIDFDPDIIASLQAAGINCIYGDAEDIEFLDEINVAEAKLVVSTIPDYEANSFLLMEIRKTNQNSMVILLSYNIDEAISLYEKGATYVVLPHFIGGEFAAQLAEEAGFDINKVSGKRDEHLNYLRERKRLGHAHPVWAHNIINR